MNFQPAKVVRRGLSTGIRMRMECRVRPDANVAQAKKPECGFIERKARTVQRELHASNLYGRVGIRKPLVTARHALQRRQWCRTHRQWTPQQWQQVIRSDESTFTLFQTTGRVMCGERPKKHLLLNASC
ncbi:transposable element Tcb1 transposase [Trichonephila clavipes]|nr:transposable element Tcb1 transposase [Trichonephila clavipes]